VIVSLPSCLYGCMLLQVVNGPEVLSKYVGQAEENIRNLCDCYFAKLPVWCCRW
jgi:hypothetical protein